MSKLCGKDILLYIYDEDMRYLYEYQSNDMFNLLSVQNVIKNQLPLDQN